MQLIIKKVTSATVESNVNELDLYMQETKSKYSNWVVVESEITNAKEERAKLNKLEKNLSDIRKQVQKEGLTAINDFIEKIKESEKDVKTLSKNIDEQIKSFEEQEIDKKLKEVSEIKNRIFESNKKLEGFFTPNKKWENKTFKIKDVETEIQEMFYSLNKKYEFIIAQLNACNEEIENKIDFDSVYNLMNEEYDTIMKKLVEKKNQIKETETNIKQKAEQEKQKALAELEQKKELEKVEAIEKVKQETIEENKTESTISKIETVENTATIPNEAKKTYLVIEVTGLNMNVAKELKQFLDGNNINYKKEIK